MPWRIVSNSAKCPGGKPFAVIKEADGSVAGCHETRSDATAQLRALYASEPRAAGATVNAASEAEAECMSCGETPALGENEVTWEGPLVVEGVETGDGRMFAVNALSWPELPIPLLYQRVTSHGGSTDESVNVGRIDQIWRDGNVLMGRGVLDLVDPNGVEAARKIRGKYLRGVSIDADSVKESDVEFVFPEVAEDATEDELLAAMFAQPELTIYHNARIRGTTLVNIPAFVEASIELIESEVLTAALLRDDPSFERSTVVVAAGGAYTHTITIPDVPPAWWFEEPTELPPIGALWVTDEGRVFGIVGPSGVAHRAFRNKRVEIPMGRVDYSAWMNKPTIVQGGDRVATGIITMQCGHASMFGPVDTGLRMQHYENSCSIAARVRIGESKHLGAPWVAGGLMPMDHVRLQEFMGCQLSGDWAPHREKPGWQEFVAALAVPVPGFARATTQARVRVENGVIVASAVPIRYWSDSPQEQRSNRERIAAVRQRLGMGDRNRAKIAAIRDRLNTPTE